MARKLMVAVLTLTIIIYSIFLIVTASTASQAAVTYMGLSNTSANKATGTDGMRKYLYAPSKDSIVGVWVHLQANTYGTLAGTMSRHYFVFYPDGRFMWGIPDGGLYNFNFEERKEASKVSDITPDYGTYTFKGGKGKLYGNNGTTLEITMNDQYGSLDIGNYKGFMFIPPLDGMRIEGKFTLLIPNLDGVIPQEDAEEDPGSFLNLNKDGTFDDKKGIFRWEPGNYPTIDEFFPSEEESEKLVHPGKGTYEIKDFSLILHYEDGLTTKHRILLDVIEMSELDYTSGIISPKQIWIRRERPRSNLLHLGENR